MNPQAKSTEAPRPNSRRKTHTSPLAEALHRFRSLLCFGARPMPDDCERAADSDACDAANSVTPLLCGKYRVFTAAPIGSGTFSRVFRAVDIASGETVAVKIIDEAALRCQPALYAAVEREITLLKAASHPAIVAFRAAHCEERHVVIVTEAARAGDLFSLVAQRRRLEERFVARLLLPIAEGKALVLRRLFLMRAAALRFLHEDCGIAHRDVKLENILVDDASDEAPRALLCDFGLATLHRAACCLQTRCGSEEYAPPEIVRGEPYDGRSSDVWSFGVVIYAALFGVFPFAPAARSHGALRFPAAASAAACDLLAQMCRDAPADRLAIDAVLKHAFWRAASCE